MFCLIPNIWNIFITGPNIQLTIKKHINVCVQLKQRYWQGVPEGNHIMNKFSKSLVSAESSGFSSLLYFSTFSINHPKPGNGLTVWLKKRFLCKIQFSKFPLAKVISFSSQLPWIYFSFKCLLYVYIDTHIHTQNLSKKWTSATEKLLKLLLSQQTSWLHTEVSSEPQEVFLCSTFFVIIWSPEILHSRHQMGW